ncbi:hypothetical protein FHS31_000727 [Sphingomonas vulcanisoli]|uniref:TraB/GumN family protein n=1 Tax=Sphingomonas vulcanisoli TaxID=1658060 RepID=A0ABX0TRI3_9SPHN|nr:TraB/GumN family protein [Sphingomonas vulcanisoli]NIJ07145.1 hypothetical protein [Sphingomonas vulcanisoli]
MKHLLLPLAFLAAPLLAKAPTAPRPALWKIADADTTIYLFGTIHVLPKGLQWRDAAIDKALADSQSLTLETVLDDDPGRVARALTTMGVAKRLPPLADRVPEAKKQALAALVAQSGFPIETLDRMKSWAAAIVLTGASFSQIGLEPGGEGVEPQLSKLFRAAGKPIEGFETPEQQLGFFDALSETAQRAFLVSALDDPKKARADFDQMLRSWAKGDVAAIARAFAEEPEFTPQLRELLVKRRDKAWADALAKRMEKPGTMFVAVGAGHLAGPDSVQRMLAERKIVAVRVQ